MTEQVSTTNHQKARMYLDMYLEMQRDYEKPEHYIQLAIAHALLDISEELASIKYTLRRLDNP